MAGGVVLGAADSATDTRHARLAEVLVDYSTRVAPGELVLIEAPALAAPLVEAIYRRVLEAGAHPLPRIAIDGLAELLLQTGDDDQLAWLNPARVQELEQVDVRIGVDASWNTKSPSTVDPARQRLVGRARQPLQDRYLEPAARRELRWGPTA